MNPFDRKKPKRMKSVDQLSVEELSLLKREMVAALEGRSPDGDWTPKERESVRDLLVAAKLKSA